MSCQRNVFNFEYMWKQKKAPTPHERNFPGQTFHMNKNTKKKSLAVIMVLKLLKLCTGFA